MGANKELFELMRAEEMATLYDSTFSKKEASATGKKLVQNMLDDGEVNSLQFWANLARLNEVISSAVSELRERVEVFEKTTILGVEFNPVNGGETLNFEDDDVYFTLKSDLKSREEMLKLAYKSKDEFFDAYGNHVPKVSSKPRKSSVTIKF